MLFLDRVLFLVREKMGRQTDQPTDYNNPLLHIHARVLISNSVWYKTLIIMWYQRVCNCRQYCFDLVMSHQCSTAYTHVRDKIQDKLYPQHLEFSHVQCSTACNQSAEVGFNFILYFIFPGSYVGYTRSSAMPWILASIVVWYLTSESPF